MAVPVRRPDLAVLGTILVVAALGLPWSFDNRTYVSGWLVPSTCIPQADGTMWCSPGFMSPGYVLGSGAASGVHTPARVFLVAALVLVAFAVHRSSARLLAVAGGSALVGVLLAGPVLLGGPVAAVTGGVLLLHSGGVSLPRPRFWPSPPDVVPHRAGGAGHIRWSGPRAVPHRSPRRAWR